MVLILIYRLQLFWPKKRKKPFGISVAMATVLFVFHAQYGMDGFFQVGSKINV